MCGFAGFAVGRSPSSWDPDEVLARMNRSLIHRGPDDEGTWVDGGAGVFLGFRRLSILDLSEAGRQPMVSKTSRFVLTFNGEVYNHAELRRQIGRRSSAYRGRSDTEVLLSCFEAWGVEESLGRFRGMFAMAVWDRDRRELWLARDGMGIKPLFLFTDSGSVAFASEIRAFHDFPPCPCRGDLQAAALFLKRLHVPSSRTILEGVERLNPGSFRVYGRSSGVFRETRRGSFFSVSDLLPSTMSRDPSQVVDELQRCVRESVSLRMVADVPVGAFLSGGVDSSIVTGVMQELSTEPVKTFTVSFDDRDFDESHSARMVAEHLGTDHTDVQFPTSQAEALLPTLPALSDEPMANPSLLPTILVSRVARNSVVVALSGDGGDELFGGYNRYRLDGSLIRMGRRVPYVIRQLAARGLRGVGASGDVAIVRAALRALGFGSQQSNRERLEKLARVLGARTDQDAYTSLLEVGFPRPPLELGQIEEEVLESNPWALPDASLLQRMLMSDQLQYLPGDLLAKVDRASMWESLEVRVPLLDPRVVEFSWGLPDEIKLRKGIGKWPLRELAYRYVPREVIDRPKMGFTVPITRWMGGGLKNWMQDMLLSNESRRVPWDRDTLAGHIVAFDRGRDDLALSLWAAAVLQSWSDSWGVTF